MNIHSPPFEKILETDEEDLVFEILSHPLRRKILESLLKNGGISYSTLLHKWKMSTGSIYHHLKIMKPFLYQDENYIYRLTNLGKQSCDRYLQVNQVEEKKSPLNSVTHNFLTILESHQVLSIVVSLVILNLGYFLSRSLDAVIAGPFILAIEHSIFLGKLTSVEPVLLIDMLIVTVLLVFYILTAYIFSNNKSKFQLKLLVSGYLVSSIPSGLIIIIIYCLTLFESIVISLQLWILLCSLTQFFILLVNNAILVRFCRYKIERSVIVVLLNGYLSLSIAYFLI